MDDGEATHHSERPEKTLTLSVRTRGQWHPKQPITIPYRRPEDSEAAPRRTKRLERQLGDDHVLPYNGYDISTTTYMVSAGVKCAQ